MRKRQQVIAMLLSLTMTFGLCGSSLTAQTVKAQEAQEVQVGQIQEEVREDTVETGQDKAPEDTAGEVADDMQRPEADVPASDGEAEDAADKTVPEDEKEEEKISDESEGKEQLKGSSGKSETNTFESDDYKRYGSEQTLTAEGLINDVYTYVFWGGIKDGAAVKMEAEAVSTYENARLSYEWYKATDENYSLEDAEKLSESSSVLRISKKGDRTEYYICKVSDANETQQLEFEIAGDFFRVSKYVNDMSYDASEEFTYGEDVKLEVKTDIDSKYQVSYQWSKDYEDIENATDSIYRVKLDSPNRYMSQNYSCEVTVQSGGTVIANETCRFIMDIKKTLSVNSWINGEKVSPKVIYAYEGEKVTLKVSADSSLKDSNISYKWSSEELWDSGETEDSQNVLSTSEEFQFTKGSTEEQEYYCKITDGVQEKTVHFAVYKKSKIEGIRWINDKKTSSAYVSRPEDTYELRVDVTPISAGDNYEYQWQKYDGIDDMYWAYEDSEWYQTVSSSGASCKVSGREAGDKTYRCIVKNNNDVRIFKFTLYADSLTAYRTVNQERKERAGELDKNKNYCTAVFAPGDTVTLGAKAESSYASQSVTYKWYSDDYESEDSRKLLGQGETYRFVKKEETERYFCVVSDGFQSEELEFEIGEKSSIEGNPLIDGKLAESDGYHDACAKAVDGRTYQLEMQMTSTPKSGTYRYKWGTYNESIGILQRLSTASKCTVQIGAYENEGDYYVCEVADGKEKRMFSFYLDTSTLEGVQKLNGKLLPDEVYLDGGERVVYLDAGEQAVLSVDAVSADTEPVAYAWNPDNYTEVEGTAAGNQYKVIKQKGKWQLYYCEASDSNTIEKFGFALEDNTLNNLTYAIDGKKIAELKSEPGTKHTLSAGGESSVDDADISYRWFRIDENGFSTEIENKNKNALAIIRKDDVEAYCCEVSDGNTIKNIYFNFSSNDVACKHEFDITVTKATLNKDGSIVNRCSKCGKVDSSTVIPYPKTIRLSSETFTYNGKVHRPAVTVIGSNGSTIAASNYTVSYSAGSTAAGTYAATITFKGNYTGSVKKTYTIKNSAPSAGTVLRAPGTKASYKVVKAGKTVEYKSAPNKKVKTASVPSTVKINNVTYKVTGIAPSAFKNCKKLKKVTIGANVTSIGKQAFYGCKSLKTVTVKSKSVKKVGSKAFKGIHKKASIKVPKAKLKAYKKLLKKGGVSKSVKIKK